MLKFSALSIAFVCASVGFTGYAQERGPALPSKHYIANAVQLQVTLRGQKYFETQMQPILENVGYNFSEGYFPQQTITSDKPINLEQLKKSNPEAYKLYVMGKDLLTKWFVGFTLTDHRPAVQIGNSGYQASFSKFALLTDEALLKTLGKKDGAVLAIDLVVTKLAISTKNVRAWDLNNLPFAKVGLDDVSLVAGDEKTPLKLRLPFYVRINAKENIEFQALEMQENLQQVPLVLKYKNLVVPKIAIEIDGHKYAMNTDQLKSYLDDQLPNILTQVRKYLSDFAKKQLPEMLNEKAKESMAGALEQVQSMTPSGQEPNDRRPPFIWGLKLTSLNLKSSLNLGLKAYIEDALNPEAAADPSAASRGLPNMSLVPANNYDIALSVDRGMINRILQLSFLRKNFDAIKDSDGSVMKLTAAPTVDYVQAPYVTADKEAFLKLRVSVEIDPKKPMWLERTIILNFDILARMRPTGQPGKMELIKYSIDKESLAMSKKYLTFAGKIAEAFGHQVTKGIKEELANRSKNWAKNAEKISGDIDLPPSLYGMTLDVNKMNMDPNGHLVMYLNYHTANRAGATGVKK